jgi:hypothetical protein
MTEVYQVDLAAGAPDWPEGKKWHWHEQVLYGFPQGWKVVLQLPLTAMQWRVLLGLVCYCDWGNRCRVTAAQLGRDLRVHRSTVLRALRALQALRLLILETTHGQPFPVVTLSPALLWKGRPWHLAYARYQFDAAWRLHALPAAGTTTVRTADAAPARVVPHRHAEPPPPHSGMRGLPHLSPTGGTQ